MRGCRYEYYDAPSECGVSEKFLQSHARKFGDCPARAIHKATGVNYLQVVYELMLIQPSHLRRGMDENLYRRYLIKRGWKQVVCKPHISFAQMPKKGTYICELADHITVIKDGVNWDNEDWRCWKIVSYWRKK